MIWVRKSFVHLLSVILFASLVGGVAALNLNRVFGNPEHIKTLVAQSGVYDKLAASTLQQAQTDNSGDSSVSLSDPTVQKAADQTFTPDLLRKSFETFIDANYAWLEGKTATPQFNIDLSGAKNDFAAQVGAAVTNHLKSAPVCTAAQMAALQIPVNPLTVGCRPSTLDPQTEGNRVAQEVRSNNDFLSQPDITPTTINQDAKTDGKPYYLSASRAPHVFQLVKKGVYILGALALVTAAGIIFIAPTRRRGWRRVGVVLIEAGVVLVVTKFLADSAVNKLAERLHKGAAKQFGDQTNALVHTVETQLFQYNLWAGIVFLAAGLAIIIWLLRGRRGGKPKPAATPAKAAPVSDDEDDDPEPINPDEIKLAPPRREPSPMQKVATPKPVEATTAPTLETEDEPAPKPKKPKPPLIQG